MISGQGRSSVPRPPTIQETAPAAERAAPAGTTPSPATPALDLRIELASAIREGSDLTVEQRRHLAELVHDIGSLADSAVSDYRDPADHWIQAAAWQSTVRRYDRLMAVAAEQQSDSTGPVTAARSGTGSSAS